MTMRETALALARRGFKVFPIRAGAKAPPLISAWQTAATSAEAQVESWWTQWPQANVGIHTEGLLVIDVDPKKGGYEALDQLHAALAEEDGYGLDATYEVETPSGGRHIYYRSVEPLRNGVDILGPGLDVRTLNGYVVAPGSRTAAGEYRVVVDEPICDAAPELVARCRTSPPPAPDRPQVPISTDADAAVARALEFLRLHPVAVEGQGGDHHTYRTVCRIRDFGVPEDRALEALGDWNSRCNPPWEYDELTRKIENAYTYAQDAPGKLTPEALGFEVVEEARTGNEDDRTENENTRELMHPADVVLDDVLKTEYLIKGVLERQSNAVLFGHWNVGKTFMVLDMAASIACGLPWFGKRVKAGRVLYLGYEGLRAMKKRLSALRDKYPMLNDRTTPFRYEGLTAPLTRPEGVKEFGAVLAAFARLHGGAPDLIIIDPLANALGGDDSDAMLMGALNELVAVTIKRQHCTVMRVHHSGHGNQDRARGHSSLPAGVDTEIQVTEQEVKLTKQRDDVRGTLFFKLDVVKLGTDADGDPVTTCIVQQIEDNPLSPELSRPQREVLDALLRMRGEGGRVTKTEVNDQMPASYTATQKREMLRALETKQYLRSEGKGFVICERGPAAMFDEEGKADGTHTATRH